MTTPMTNNEIVELMARGACTSGGLDPDFVMANDGPRWRYYIPLVEESLRALEAAGCRIVQGWLPIESAPVDRVILGWRKSASGCLPMFIGERLPDKATLLDQWSGRRAAVTHWQPLPAPPAGKVQP